MPERRSSRSRNTVTYSGFDDSNESDDDFADSSHPAKKQKSSKTDEPTKKPQKVAKDKSLNFDGDVLKKSMASSQSSTKVRRAPLSEKIYERELQEALELSLLETGLNHGAESHNTGDRRHQPSQAVTVTTVAEVSHQGQLASGSGTTSAESHPQQSSSNTTSMCDKRYAHGTVVIDDSIQLAEADLSDDLNKQRQTRTANGRQTRKKPQRLDLRDKSSDESDFAPDDDSDKGKTSSEGDDDDEMGSDFDCRPAKLKTAKPHLKDKSSTVTSKMPQPIQTRIKHVAKQKQVKSKPSGSSNAPTISVTVSRQCSTSPSGVATPSLVTAKSSSSATRQLSQKVPSSLVSQWKPPSRASSNGSGSPLSIVKSPSSGLRLGLSRNQKVKPLHPSVQVS